MILTDIQRKILSSVIMQADATESDIARILKIRESTVRTAIRMFLDKGILVRRSIFVDPIILGLSHYIIPLSLPLNAAKKKKQLIKALAEAEETAAVYELGGEFQIEARVYVRNVLHLEEYLERIASQFPEHLHIGSLLSIVHHEYSGVWHADAAPKARPLFNYGASVSPRKICTIDEQDHVILAALANLYYLSIRQVARALSIPPSTLSYRISHLEKIGVIKGHYYIVDVKVFRESPYFLQVKSRVLTSAEKFAFRRFCQLHPRIPWMSFLLGERTAEILARVANHDEATAIVEELSHHFGDVLGAITMTPLSNFFKFSTYPLRKYSTLTGR